MSDMGPSDGSACYGLGGEVRDRFMHVRVHRTTSIAVTALAMRTGRSPADLLREAAIQRASAPNPGKLDPSVVVTIRVSASEEKAIARAAGMKRLPPATYLEDTAVSIMASEVLRPKSA